MKRRRPATEGENGNGPEQGPNILQSYYTTSQNFWKEMYTPEGHILKFNVFHVCTPAGHKEIITDYTE